MLNPFNVVLITMDAVRPDHLGAYGYDGISTPNIDEIAREGVLFEGATAASCLTPIAHGSILTGNNPPVHNMRDPFSHLKTPTISETLKEHGYATAGFVAVGFLNAVHGFGRGFDHYNEPKEERVWGSKNYVSDDGKEEMECLFGNLWRYDMLGWLGRHGKERFFIFGHYFECHWDMENQMLKEGLLERGHLPENGYYGVT
jgi:arylsulfatase A-like enzyme